MLEIPIRVDTSTSCFRALPVYTEGYPFATIPIYPSENSLSSGKSAYGNGFIATSGPAWR